MKIISNLVGLMMVMVVILTMFWVSNVGGVSVFECAEEIRLGIAKCTPVVRGAEPSPECCERVRVSHAQCICPVMSQKLTSRIGNDRALRVLRTCGRFVPPNARCGGIHS